VVRVVILAQNEMILDKIPGNNIIIQVEVVYLHLRLLIRIILQMGSQWIALRIYILKLFIAFNGGPLESPAIEAMELGLCQGYKANKLIRVCLARSDIGLDTWGKYPGPPGQSAPRKLLSFF